MSDDKEPRVDPQSTITCTAQYDMAVGVTVERGKVYGPPGVDFARAAAIKAALVDCPDPRVRHALEMIGVKMARLVQSPTPNNIDSVIDIAGYARTIVMLWDEDDDAV